MLETVFHGTPTAVPTLIVAHGLFGSARNWNAIAKRLSDDRQVIAVDMRNHGNSFRDPEHSYPAMAADLAEVISANGGTADVLGHSMGGKAAMALALTQPDLVQKLIVADIAPVAYSHSQQIYVTAMQKLDLDIIKRRRDADAQLAKLVEDPGIRAFLLQSLSITEECTQWRLNLDVLGDQMETIVGFPEFDTEFTGSTLFLTGGKSDYVRSESLPVIRALFPKFETQEVDGAGHWLHAEKPEEFSQIVASFLQR